MHTIQNNIQFIEDPQEGKSSYPNFRQRAFKPRYNRIDKESHYILDKERIQKEGVTILKIHILNICVPNII